MKRIDTKQTRRYALTLPATLQAALLPPLEALDPDAARHLRAAEPARTGDVIAPLTNHHLLHLARVAAQHLELPGAQKLLNTIANELA